MKKNFRNDQSGATAIEYGLIAALIAVAIITMISTFNRNNESTKMLTDASEKLRIALECTEKDKVDKKDCPKN